jgi:hypothetical protein
MITFQLIVDVDFTNSFRENDSIFGPIKVVITSYSLLIPCRQLRICMQMMECTQQASQMCQPGKCNYDIEYLMATTINIMSSWILSLWNPSSINHCTNHI